MREQPTILVAVDFFGASIAALREAGRIRETRGAKLVVMHVVDERLWHPAYDEFKITTEDVVNRAKARIRYEVTELIGPDSSIEMIVNVGHPVEEIERSLTETGADLLVLGAKGMQDDGGPALGDVAGRLLRHASTDVLVVRRSQAEPFQKMLACFDFSEAADTVFTRALEMAESDHSELTVIHSMPHLPTEASRRNPLQALGVSEVRVEGQSEERFKRKVEEDLESYVKDRAKQAQHARVHTEVLASDHPARALLAYVEEHEPDLLVLGKHGKSKLNGIPLGGTAEKICNGVSCSVCAVA